MDKEISQCFCGGEAVFEEWLVAEAPVAHRLVCNRCNLSTEWFQDTEQSVADWENLQEQINRDVNGE